MLKVTDEVEVRAFEAAQWQIFRRLRLAALQDAPSAFGSVYADAMLYSDQQWQDRLDGIDLSTNFPMLGLLSQQPVAMGWVMISPRAISDDRSIANLYQMWTAPEARSRGAGKALVTAAQNWCRQHQVTLLELAVTEGNVSAERLYVEAGFEFTGETSVLRDGSKARVRHMSQKF